MWMLMWSTLRQQSRHYVAPGIAIFLGVMFAAVTMIGTNTVTAATEKSLVGEIGTADVIVTADGITMPDGTLAAIQKVSPDLTIETFYRGYVRVGTSFSEINETPKTGNVRLLDGRWPTNNNEVTVTGSSAATSADKVGGTIVATSLDGDDGTEKVQRTLRIVGVADINNDPNYQSDVPIYFVQRDTIQKVAGTSEPQEIRISGANANGKTPSELKKAISAAVPQDAIVRTKDDEVFNRLAKFNRSLDLVRSGLMAFVVISLFVSAMVVTNTFAVLYTRRAQQTALVRCLGATTSQFRRSSLIEAVIVSTVAGILGIAAAIMCIAFGFEAFSDILGLGVAEAALSVSPTSVFIPLILGIIVTVIAAVRPVFAAGKVSPVAALSGRIRRTASPSRVLRLSRAIFGSVFFLGGTMILIAGNLIKIEAQPAAFLAVIGTITSFIGVLILGRFIVPVVASVLGKFVSPVSVPGELAVGNALRERRRTTTTVSALLIGIVLITALMVGSESAKASFTHELDTYFPVDATVFNDVEPVDNMTVTSLAAVQGVERIATVTGGTLTVPKAQSGDDQQVNVVALDRDALNAVRNPETFAVPTGSAKIDSWTADQLAISTGQTIELNGPDGTRQFVAQVDDKAFHNRVVLNPADLLALLPEPRTSGVLLRLTSDRPSHEVLADLRGAIGSSPNAELTGAIVQRSTLDQALNGIMLFIAGLIAISILISLIGVTNTLALSVLERRRELGVLRAMGLSGRQARSTVMWEATLLSAVGVVIGATIGLWFGLTGSRALINSSATPIVSIPWAGISLVWAGALIAGVVASVVPALTATKISPAEAVSKT